MADLLRLVAEFKATNAPLRRTNKVLTTIATPRFLACCQNKVPTQGALYRYLGGYADSPT